MPREIRKADPTGNRTLTCVVPSGHDPLFKGTDRSQFSDISMVFGEDLLTVEMKSCRDRWLGSSWGTLLEAIRAGGYRFETIKRGKKGLVRCRLDHALLCLN